MYNESTAHPWFDISFLFSLIAGLYWLSLFPYFFIKLFKKILSQLKKTHITK